MLLVLFCFFDGEEGTRIAEDCVCWGNCVTLMLQSWETQHEILFGEEVKKKMLGHFVLEYLLLIINGENIRLYSWWTVVSVGAQSF